MNQKFKLKTGEEIFVLAEDEKTRMHQIRMLNSEDYYPELKADIAKADKIIIGLTTLQKKIIAELKNIQASGKHLTLVLPQKYQDKNKDTITELMSFGIQIIWHQAQPQLFVVCDEDKVWYGNLLFFGFNRGDATSIRLVSIEVAKQLKKQYKILS